MIQELCVKGFKRFESQSFSMKPLTVLAGRNGGGKTSVIHALLLVHHAVQRKDGVAELNGPFGIELGWFGDLLNVEDAFSVSLQDDDGNGATWTFTEGDTELHGKDVVGWRAGTRRDALRSRSERDSAGDRRKQNASGR